MKNELCALSRNHAPRSYLNVKLLIKQSVVAILTALLPYSAGHAQDAALLARAQAGDAQAQTELGYVYAVGQGVEQNFQEALRWFLAATRQGYAESLKWLRMSAEGGYPTGQFKLGAMYANATGVTQDFAEAAKWYQLAAERGHMSAQFELGDLYIAGSGVQRDYTIAGRLFLAAAKQGHPEAQYNIGEMYAAG